MNRSRFVKLLATELLLITAAALSRHFRPRQPPADSPAPSPIARAPPFQSESNRGQCRNQPENRGKDERRRPLRSLPLPPGVYNITVTKEGFSAFVISGLKVDVSASLSRNITLEVGTISQSVSVTAEAAIMQTDSPSVASTIVRQQIEELPLNGRDFNQLVLLSADRWTTAPAATTISARSRSTAIVPTATRTW